MLLRKARKKPRLKNSKTGVRSVRRLYSLWTKKKTSLISVKCKVSAGETVIDEIILI